MIRRVHGSRIAPDAEIGGRVQVVGNSGSGKSTLGARLAEAMGAPFVELDALNWLPGWVGLNQTDPDRFERRIREATLYPSRLLCVRSKDPNN
ncbi:MAG: hypothetical protein OXH46_11095, partial [Gemmatimonadetes bacterium]|nr:hypothetical protein [Gemmatimonadota bacterium]